MALNKQILKQHLNALYDDQATRETDPAQARIDFVNGLADAFEAYVKSGQVTGTVATPNGASPILNGLVI